MSRISDTAPANTYPSQSFGGGENDDLKQLRKAEARESLKDGIEAFKITEKKKNIEAIR
ncbi:type III secretion effector protein [Pseudomonas yamanorum]|uniref:Type III secretion effector protein n=1 Tax=Pseudomonas yamanorum TaxID=515393 RepID=A0AAJ3H606_9PSED|nr:type III secretion effector protein [Pseudomonas yamanorum]NWD43744.1 type III secretion effector protein [Pseudomonas yamanorum]WVN18044.1 type III secretion effector protein [Pseudomonas yamanorum]